VSAAQPDDLDGVLTAVGLRLRALRQGERAHLRARSG
jgi:hypothetical protein